MKHSTIPPVPIAVAHLSNASNPTRNDNPNCPSPMFVVAQNSPRCTRLVLSLRFIIPLVVAQKSPCCGDLAKSGSGPPCSAAAWEGRARPREGWRHDRDRHSEPPHRSADGRRGARAAQGSVQLDVRRIGLSALPAPLREERRVDGSRRHLGIASLAREGRAPARPHGTPPLTGNAAILAAHGKARAGCQIGTWPLRVVNALAKTRRTPKTPRTVPAWSVSSQAIFWPASYFLDSKPFISAQACLATVMGVLGVLSVLARPPENEIPSGRPANPQWHSTWIKDFKVVKVVKVAARMAAVPVRFGHAGRVTLPVSS